MPLVSRSFFAQQIWAIGWCQPFNSSLEPLYRNLSSEIRKVDAHHILFLGGAQWDTNFSVFGKPFDANVVYTFHKYWTAPDESVLRQYIDFRERHDVPLWMGESGENTDEWIAQFVKALEKNNIGWAKACARHCNCTRGRTTEGPA